MLTTSSITHTQPDTPGRFTFMTRDELQTRREESIVLSYYYSLIISFGYLSVLGIIALVDLLFNILPEVVILSLIITEATNLLLRGRMHSMINHKLKLNNHLIFNTGIIMGLSRTVAFVAIFIASFFSRLGQLIYSIAPFVIGIVYCTLIQIVRGVHVI